MTPKLTIVSDRDALHEAYDPPFEQRRIAREYEHRVMGDCLTAPRHSAKPEPSVPLSRPSRASVGYRELFTADELIFATFVGVFIGAMLTVAIAWMVAFL